MTTNTVSLPARPVISVPMTKHIDIAALAQHARIPADDPGVLAFAKLVVEHCASLCVQAKPAGDADHVSQAHVAAVGRELGSQLRAMLEAL
jgi:hypothetical protein